MTDMTRIFSRYKGDMTREAEEMSIEEQRAALREGTELGRHRVLDSLLPMVLAYVGRLSAGWRLEEDERMDLVQAGNLGALQALQSFDPDHDEAVYPWTWCKLYIKRQVIREGNLIMTGRASGGDFYFEDIEVDDWAQLMHDDRFLSSEPEPHEQIHITELRDAMSLLEDDELALMEAVYWEGRTLIELAEELGLTGAAVHKRIRRVEGKLFQLVG